MMNRVNKRIGKWSWALSADERVTAAVFSRAQSEGSRISAKLKAKYEAMLKKQEKLLARAPLDGLRMRAGRPTVPSNRQA